MQFLLWVSRLWCSLCAGGQPVRLGGLLHLLLLLLHQLLLLLLLSPSSSLQHSHSDSAAAQYIQLQQQPRCLGVPKLPMLVSVQQPRAGQLQWPGRAQLHIRQVLLRDLEKMKQYSMFVLSTDSCRVLPI